LGRKLNKKGEKMPVVYYSNETTQNSVEVNGVDGSTLYFYKRSASLFYGC
jgi:hypothetical protein